MEWDRYKTLCDAPNVLSRWMLEQTKELTEPALSALLEQVLEGNPISKPLQHRGDRMTDMFMLDVAPDRALAIARSVAEAVAASRTSRATRSRGLGGFQAAWEECAEYLEKGRQ